MTCPYCLPHIGKTKLILAPGVTSDPPKCAFDSRGRFVNDNWNCGTMVRLRNLRPELDIWNEDQFGKIVPLPESFELCGAFLVLGWYKRHGRTELAFLFSDTKRHQLTLTRAQRILEAMTREAA